MTLLYIFSTLNDRGLPLSDADSDPIDIKLKRERRTKAEERSLSSFLLRKQLKVTLKQGCNDFKITLSKAIRLESEVDAFYWTVLAPDIVNPGREEQGSFSV
jgi:hypothetical protein